MTMLIKKAVGFPFPLVISWLFWLGIVGVVVGGANAKALNENNNKNNNKNNKHERVPSSVGSLVRKDERESLVSTEYGEISAVEISDGSSRGRYHLQFITLEPNALFLPVLLHRDMVFYVHTGTGRLSWVDKDEMRRVNLQRGDVFRLPTGSIFFLQSNLEQERQKLRIYSLFTNSIQDLQEPSPVGAAAYSSIPDLVLGFDKKTLQAAFNVSEDVIEELRSGTPQAIVHAPPKKGSKLWQFEAQFVEALLGSDGNSIFDIENKKTKTFNILKAKPDFQNHNGRSLMVTKKKLPALSGSNIGLFMVNLTNGSMMGPHWNPKGSEISIVTQGRGIVRVVCSSSRSESECKNTRFRVDEGDVFVIPRFHPMAQMAFNDDSLVFMGFSTTTKNNHPQFLVGKASVLQTLDKEVVAASFSATNTTITQLLAAQGESIILECTSCAEEAESKMEEEIEEEARRREEEEAKKREEEKRREEEEEAREEERRREEEEAARKREEEERRREEEEEQARMEEEEEEEEEEARKREEEEARREEEERRREEEEAKRREEEERRREEEEAKRREEEEEEEEERRRKEQEEEERRREEDEQARREEEKRRREEEEARREEEEKEKEERRREEEEARKEEEARREQQKKRKQKRREGQKQQGGRKKRLEDDRRNKKKWLEARREGGREEEAEEATRQEEEDQEEEKGGGGQSKPRRDVKKIWKV